MTGPIHKDLSAGLTFLFHLDGADIWFSPSKPTDPDDWFHVVRANAFNIVRMADIKRNADSLYATDEHFWRTLYFMLQLGGYK